MNEDTTLVPDLQTLTGILASALQKGGSGFSDVTILSRQPSAYASTFPSEILRCRLNGGTEKSILCKYQITDWSKLSQGHRGGVAYEAVIYDRILQHIGLSTPGFVGVHTDHHKHQVFLFLEYLEGSKRAGKVDHEEGLFASARWLGEFHAENEKRSDTFLTAYDAGYYDGWIKRTLELSGPLQSQFPWLPLVSDEFRKAVGTLLSGPLTLIHGEFYPKNILIKDGKVYPVDWESAAIAAGEIDLASLTEDWGPDVSRECQYIYQRARWNRTPPVDIDRRMNLARMYFEYRWLGDPSQWGHEAGPWRLEKLGHLAKELGFM